MDAMGDFFPLASIVLYGMCMALFALYYTRNIRRLDAEAEKAARLTPKKRTRPLAAHKTS
jgi:hypothetical protein